MKKGTFILYDVDLKATGLLSEEQTGRLFQALAGYRLRGEKPDLNDDIAVNILFNQIVEHIAINEEKYAQLCKRNSEIAKKRWQNSKNANADESIISDTNVCLYDNDTDNDTDNDNDTDACGTQKKTKKRKNYDYNNSSNKSNIPKLLRDEPNFDMKAFEQKALNLKYEKPPKKEKGDTL